MSLNRRNFALAGIALGAMFTAARRAAGQSKTWTVNIDESNAAFDPPTLTIKAGDVIQWTNPSVIVHTVDFDPAAALTAGDVALPTGIAPFSSGDLQQDATFSHKFTGRGTYKYVCKYHEAMGMKGTVIVT